MEPSLFISYVERIFPRLVLSITRTLNGADENGQRRYYFQRFLGRRFSLSGKWEALSVAGTRIMADVIAMDSSLPLKKRPALSSASGTIPKLGMEMALNESDLTNLQTMQAAPSLFPESQIIDDLFRDTTTVVTGQYERLEHMFLEGLSRGAVVVAKAPNADTVAGNVGAEIRLDFQYKADQSFEATVAWDNPAATPIQDLAVVVQKSTTTGFPIRRFLLDRITMNRILRSQDALAVMIQANNNANITLAPTQDQLNAAIQSIYGYVFEVIERTTQYQINGVDVAVQPWALGQVVGINNDRLGDVVWARLAEAGAPVAGVTYQLADEFILAKKYRVNRPSLAEFTASEARAVPVVSAVQQIFHIDTTVDGGEDMGIEGGVLALRQAAGIEPKADDSLASIAGEETTTTAKTTSKK